MDIKDLNISHKRRLRYKGTNPRRFEEKYKELNAERYTADIQKVIGRGQTPAGTHRPICVKELLDVLDPKPGMTGLDATLGYGGHAREILKKIVPGGKLYGIDVDPIELPRTETRLRKLGFGDEVLIVRRMNFAGLPQLVTEIGCGFDFILADLGVSSMQLDDPSRGFSYKNDGPLDLRLNPHKGRPASELLKDIPEEDLIKLLIDNADEPHARTIAHVLCGQRGFITTTKQCANIIIKSLSGLHQDSRSEETKKSIQRVFQALRIAVNEEFEVLDRFLRFLPDALKSGGKAAILTFHSGEDRRVKKSFRRGLRTGIYGSIAREPIRPSSKERHDNPRSVSAKLRWAVKQHKMWVGPQLGAGSLQELNSQA